MGNGGLAWLELDAWGDWKHCSGLMFRTALATRLSAAFAAAQVQLPEGFTVTVSLASDTRFGDYQSNAPMVLAKQLKTNPRALAQSVVDHLKVDDLCSGVSIDGPGFLNFRISPEALAGHLKLILADDQAGVPKVAESKTIVVDFSAPNIAKPMHVGHIRSTFIGDCLARISRHVGHQVITDNHVGDWGTQFGMILHGWKTLMNHDALKVDPINELVRCYKEVNAKAKADVATLEVCKGELVKLQSGDAENLGIWKECVRMTMEQLEKVYQTLEISFDHYLGESFYNDALNPLVERLLASGLAQVSDGAVVIFSDGKLAPENDPFFTREGDAWKAVPAIIRKSDGGSLYATTDLATIDYRVQEWKAQEIWYVVGAPQQLHFRQVFNAAQRMGHDVGMTHVAFGSILGPDGKMFKTRSGETVGLLELIDEAIERARAVVDEKQADLAEAEKAEIARIIGGGAVKYAELSQNRLTDYKFSWDKMLSMQGNTAPYLVNAYVRTRSIFRKLEGSVEMTADCQLTEPAEQALAMKLAQFAEATHDVLEGHRCNVLATYLYELANTYHSFYEACHVLNSTGTVRNTRLLLCDATSKVLKTGLGLMGISTTERM
jgi:arginyl-tRNA synthetase